MQLQPRDSDGGGAMIDCVEMLESFAKLCGPEVRNARRGPWVHFLCPNCDDKKGKFGVNVETSWCNCWRCGLKGGAFSLLRKRGIKIRHYKARKRLVQTEELLPVPQFIPGYVDWFKRADSATVKRGIDYFHERNINHRQVEWGVSTDPALSFRVVFPVRYRGEIVSYQARSVLQGVSAKTVSGSSKKGWVQTSKLLYRYDSQPKNDNVVICEGPADAVRVQGVALFGSTVSPAQRLLLSSLKPDRLTIFLDSDAREKANKVAVDLFGVARQTAIVEYEDGEEGDPCSLSEPEDKIENAMVFKYKTDLLRWILKGRGHGQG